VAKPYRLRTVVYPGALAFALAFASSECHDDRILGEVPDPRPPVADANPPVVDAVPPVADAVPPVADAVPPVADANPPVADANPPVADANPPVADAASPILCGGVFCDGWCERPSGHCDIEASRGICRLHIRTDERNAFLTSCVRGQPAVRACGCDGNDYASDCYRRLAEVSTFSSEASCPTPLPCAGQTDCARGEFCDFFEGRCSSQGACRPGGPDALALLCDPDSGLVCGCDGKMYASECARHRAGVSQAPGPPCPAP
jgi:hypothetical protein